MGQGFHFRMPLISSTVIIVILTLFFIVVILKEAVKKSVTFFLLQNSFGVAALDLKLMMFVFFRTRISAEAAHLTFFDSCERECGLNEHTRICGKRLKIFTNNNHNFFFLQNM